MFLDLSSGILSVIFPLFNLVASRVSRILRFFDNLLPSFLSRGLPVVDFIANGVTHLVRFGRDLFTHVLSFVTDGSRCGFGYIPSLTRGFLSRFLPIRDGIADGFSRFLRFGFEIIPPTFRSSGIGVILNRTMRINICKSCADHCNGLLVIHNQAMWVNHRKRGYSESGGKRHYLNRRFLSSRFDFISNGISHVLKFVGSLFTYLLRGSLPVIDFIAHGFSQLMGFGLQTIPKRGGR